MSKIDELVKHDYNKLDTKAKNFIDAIKMLARNRFYLSFDSFKGKYNNYWDDHLLFRHLTRAAGTIYSTTNKNIIEINPQMGYQPKIKKIISQVFNKINDTKPEMPDGSKKRIVLILKVKLRFDDFKNAYLLRFALRIVSLF